MNYAESDGAVRFGDLYGCNGLDFIFASYHYSLVSVTVVKCNTLNILHSTLLKYPTGSEPSDKDSKLLEVIQFAAPLTVIL